MLMCFSFLPLMFHFLLSFIFSTFYVDACTRTIHFLLYWTNIRRCCKLQIYFMELIAVKRCLCYRSIIIGIIKPISNYVTKKKYLVVAHVGFRMKHGATSLLCTISDFMMIACNIFFKLITIRVCKPFYSEMSHLLTRINRIF